MGRAHDPKVARLVGRAHQPEGRRIEGGWHTQVEPPLRQRQLDGLDEHAAPLVEHDAALVPRALVAHA